MKHEWRKAEKEMQKTYHIDSFTPKVQSNYLYPAKNMLI